MAREAKAIVSIKGSVSEVKKVLDALTKEGSPNHVLSLEWNYAGKFKAEKDYDVTGNSVELNFKPNEFEHIEIYRDPDESDVLKVIVSAFSSVIKLFSTVSFFIAVKIAIEDIWEHGGGYYCAFSTFEKGLETQKEYWAWETPTYKSDGYNDWREECAHFSEINNLRFDYIEKKRDLWLLEDGSKGDQLAELKEALQEAEEKAKNADVPMTYDKDDDDDDDSENEDDGDNDGKDAEKAVSFFRQALQFGEDNDYSQAITFHTQALEFCPLNVAVKKNGKDIRLIAVILQERAAAYYRTKQLDKAISDYKKALEYEPNFEDAKDDLAVCERKLKQAKPTAKPETEPDKPAPAPTPPQSAPVGNPVCPKCGKVASKPTSKFCSKCGTKLKETCVKCGHELADDTNFCPKCGTKKGN